jgi:hypothetical protein
MDYFGTLAPFMWHVTFAIGTSIAIRLVVDLVLNCSDGLIGVSFLAGMLCAVIPGTHLYGLWLFYTQPVAITLVVTSWGLITGYRRNIPWRISLSLFGILLIFLFRSSLLWPVAIFFTILVCVAGVKQLRRSSRRSLQLMVVSGLCITLMVTLTAKNEILFGEPTQSSWSPENLSKVLIYGMSTQELQKIGKSNECFHELTQVGTFQVTTEYPICMSKSKYQKKLPSTRMLDVFKWSDGVYNYNYKDRLALEIQWKLFSSAVIRDNPLHLTKVLWPNFSERRRGSIVVFLWPSTSYVFLKKNMMILGVAGLIWTGLFAWTATVTILLCFFLFWSYLRRVRARPSVLPEVIILALTGYLSFIYLFFEIGENQRYRAELDYIFIAFAFVAISRIQLPRSEQFPG